MKLIITIGGIVAILFATVFYIGLEKRDDLTNKNSKMIDINNLKEAYFAGGCFWCMEGIFEAQEGVQKAVTGYIGGTEQNAKYDIVSTGKTKHREGVKIIYDPNIISYEKLVNLFWTQIDPTDEAGQFADRGYQYTTAIFYSTPEEKTIALKSKKKLDDSGKFDKSIATKILASTPFYNAEDYHQDYYKKSSLRYKSYEKLSGRKDYKKSTWSEELEKLNSKEEKTGYIEYSEERLKNAKQEFKILFFHADWCPTCKAFEKTVLSENIPDNILILKVDFDTENDLRKKYNILTQTSFVLVDNDGTLIKRWIGARGIDDIISKLQDVNQEKSKTYTDEELRSRLTPLQYKVAVEGGTEPAFNNEYWDNHEEGIYVDIIDGTALFSSTDKFDSGSGWPSFTKPIDDNFIEEKDDYKLLTKRTEIKSSSSHLGHVFDDGPAESGGQRYCINSAALKFIPKSELKQKGYEKYLKLFQASLKRVGVAEFKTELENNLDYSLIDIRTLPELKQTGIIAGASNLNFYKSDYKDNLDALDKSKKYLIYCRSGNRSGQTLSIMKDLGFSDVVELKDGINSWVSAGEEVVDYIK